MKALQLTTIGLFVAALLLAPPELKSEAKEIDMPSTVEPEAVRIEERIEDKQLEDYVINIVLEDWKTYRDAQYIPSIENTYLNVGIESKEEEFFSQALNDSLGGVKLNPVFYEVLSQLNPYKTTTKVYKSGIDLAYGVTQINVKLIPLARMYYRDFDSSTKSQLLFLNDYIGIKISKGLTVNEIIDEYKYCNYN